MRLTRHLRGRAPLLLLAVATSCAHPTPAALVAPPPLPTPPPRVPTTADILAASDLPVTVATPLAGDPIDVTVHRLSNGLTVYISRMPDVASVRAWTVVRAGSRDDPADATGVAHYLEHMLFKGTARIGTRDYQAERPHLDRIAALYRELRTAPEADRARILRAIDAENQQAARYAIPGELSALYKRLGIASFDARTGFDLTAYTHQVPANRLGVWATAEADRYQAPAFRQFYSELESVYEERTVRDLPERRVGDQLLAGLFPHHPYGTQPAIGTVEHLKTPRYDEMLEFHRTWYVPNDLAIVLVGDVDPSATVAQLEQAFAGWKPRPLPASRPGHIEPLTQRVDKEVLDQGRESVTLAWQLPRGQHDPATWDVIAELLGGGRGLFVQLVSTQKLQPIAVSHFELDDACFLMISATLADGQSHDQAEALILDGVHRLVAGWFSDQRVAEVALNKRVADTIAREDPDVRVSWLADIYATRREWPQELERVQRRSTIGRDDIEHEARALLGDAFVAVRRKHGPHVAPRVDKPTITPVSAERTESSAYAQELLAVPVLPLEPAWLEAGRDYVRAALDGGQLVVRHNDASDLFEVNYVFPGGQRTAPLRCEALAALTVAGSRDRSAAELREALYSLAANVSADCSDDQARLWITGIDANFESTLALVRRWLAAPRFAEAEVKLLVANRLLGRRDDFDQKDVRYTAARDYLRWGRQSTYLTALSNRQLRAITPVALGKQVRAMVATAHDTWYFGPRTPAQLDGALTLGRVTRRAATPPPRRYVPAGAPEILFVPFPSADARVYLSIPIDATSAEKRAMASLFSEFAHSYLWQQIRESRGLAYDVGGWFTFAQRKGDDDGVQATVACQADKLPEVLRLLQSLYGDFRPSPERFETAKASLIATYRDTRIQPRHVPGLIHSWSRLGFDHDPRPAEWATLRDATHDDLTAFSLAVTRRPYRVIVIGDPDRIDFAALRTIAPVRMLKPESLFSWGPAAAP